MRGDSGARQRAEGVDTAPAINLHALSNIGENIGRDKQPAG